MSCLEKLNEFYKKYSCKDRLLFWAIGKIKNPKRLDWVELESEVDILISESALLTYNKCKETMIDNFCSYIQQVLMNKVLNYNKKKSNMFFSMDSIVEEPMVEPGSSLNDLDEEVILISIKNKFKDDKYLTIYELSFMQNIPPRDIEVMTGMNNQIIRNTIFVIRKYLVENRSKFLLK